MDDLKSGSGPESLGSQYAITSPRGHSEEEQVPFVKPFDSMRPRSTLDEDELFPSLWDQLPVECYTMPSLLHPDGVIGPVRRRQPFVGVHIGRGGSELILIDQVEVADLMELRTNIAMSGIESEMDSLDILVGVNYLERTSGLLPRANTRDRHLLLRFLTLMVEDSSYFSYSVGGV